MSAPSASSLPALRPPTLDPSNIPGWLDKIFGDHLHAKRVLSLANGVTGVLTSAALGVHAIGLGLAFAQGLEDRHAIKQVDRLLSNEGIDADALMKLWAGLKMKGKSEVYVNLDWTEFDEDDHSMLVMGLQCEHGRCTPLMWKTVVKSEMKGQRNNHEDALLLRLAEIQPPDTQITIVADRGFLDHELFALLDDLGFKYIIRIRSNIIVENARGEQRAAKDWVPKGGKVKTLKDAKVTGHLSPVASVVCVKEPGMKAPWCLASSHDEQSGAELMARYAKRFTIEEMFRDIKDLRYGMGLSWCSIRRTDRRDRMFLLAALAIELLTLLGEAGERAGISQVVQPGNIKKGRQHSVFRQGYRWYQRLERLPDKWRIPLMEQFEILAAAHPILQALRSGE